MVKEKVTLNNETGLHARPASELAKIAMKYNCEINLIVNDKKINAKSPLSIMSAGIKENTEIEITCDGENENQALKEITEEDRKSTRLNSSHPLSSRMPSSA